MPRPGRRCPSVLVSNVGTTTNVRDGRRNAVSRNPCAAAHAASRAASRASSPARPPAGWWPSTTSDARRSQGASRPRRRPARSAAGTARSPIVISAIAPRYTSSGARRSVSRTTSGTGRRNRASSLELTAVRDRSGNSLRVRVAYSHRHPLAHGPPRRWPAGSSLRRPAAPIACCACAIRSIACGSGCASRNPSLRTRSPGPPQHLVDLTHGFDEAAPVDGREETQAADRVADRDLVGRLVLVARLHQLVRSQAIGSTSRCSIQLSASAEDGALPLQETHEFGYEWRGHGRIRARHVRDHQDQVLGVVLDGRDHPARPRRPRGRGRSGQPRSATPPGAGSRSARAAT